MRNGAAIIGRLLRAVGFCEDGGVPQLHVKLDEHQLTKDELLPALQNIDKKLPSPRVVARIGSAAWMKRLVSAVSTWSVSRWRPLRRGSLRDRPDVRHCHRGPALSTSSGFSCRDGTRRHDQDGAAAQLGHDDGGGGRGKGKSDRSQEQDRQKQGRGSAVNRHHFESEFFASETVTLDPSKLPSPLSLRFSEISSVPRSR